MTDQLSSDFQWALLQQQLQHQHQYQQQQQQQQLQQQQQQQHQQQQQQQPTTPGVHFNNLQGPSESSMTTSGRMSNQRNNNSNNNNNNINLDAQLWQLYQNFSSSASDANKLIPSMVTSAAPFTANEVPTHDLSQAQNMMAQYQQMQLELQMQMQMQMPPNAHMGTNSSTTHSNEKTEHQIAATTRGASNAVNQLMLQCKVEPFQRADSSVEDDDLWKAFDDEVSRDSFVTFIRNTSLTLPTYARN
jgi:hypothetical protein